MKKIRFVLPAILAFLHCCSLSFSQSVDLIKVVPPSPSSQEFEKFVDYKMTPYTGTPEISIPLHTIELKGLTIPITLSYHASGIKYQQIDGSISVGWGLSTEYRVTRTVFGRPDEHFVMPATFSDSVSILSARERDRYLTKFLYGADQETTSQSPVNLSGIYYDGEYDIFDFATPVEAGKAIISDRTTKLLAPLEISNSKFSYTSTPDSGIISIKAVDPNGNQYFFGKDVTNNQRVYEKSPSSYSYYWNKAPSAWALTNIRTPFGESVDVQYGKYTESRPINPNYVWSITEGIEESFTSGNTAAVPAKCATTFSEGEGSYSIFANSKITTPREIIFFYRSTGGYLIDSIVVKTLTNQTAKKIVFFRGGDAGHNLLDSLYIYGNNLQGPQVYKFLYNNSCPNCLPDNYGYYNANAEAFHHEFHDEATTINRHPLMEGTSYMETYPPGSIGSKVPSTPPIYYSLKQIKYPTGGSTSYEYESNQYMGLKNYTYTTVEGGGLRVKKITSNDLKNDNILERSYKYGENENGIGYALPVGGLNYRHYQDMSVDFAASDFDPPFRPTCIYHYSTSSMGDISFFISNPVKYLRVTEYFGQQGTLPSGGKIIYDYSVSYGNNNDELVEGTLQATVLPSSDGNGTLATYMQMYTPANIPQLAGKSVYTSLGSNQFKLITKDTFTYIGSGRAARYDGLKVKPYALSSFMGNYINNAPGYDYYPTINSWFRFGSYSINSGKALLKSTTSTSYSAAGDALVSSITYNYNNFDQVVSSIKNDSRGRQTTEEYQHPSDYIMPGITGTDPLSTSIKALQDSNIIEPIIEKRIYKANSDGSNKQLASAIFSEFQSNTPLMKSIYSIDNLSLLSNFTPTTTVNGVVQKDNQYIAKLAFNSYDNTGNILEQQRVNDVKEVYLWGYNNQYLVAKIVNSTYDIAKTYVTQSVLNNPSDDASLRNHLNNLRNIPGTLVTTYTYRPLIGMTSQTDANNRTTYYEYDGLGRLKLQKDHNGNIIKTMDYKYKTN